MYFNSTSPYPSQNPGTKLGTQPNLSSSLSSSFPSSSFSSSSQVGGIGSINEGMMSWIGSEVVEIQKKKKSTTNRSLKSGFEIFRTYANMAEDPYWIDFFHQASTGKLPKGCMMKDGKLIARNTQKPKSINIMSGHDAIINFFNENMGIKSGIERELDRNEYKQAEAIHGRINYSTWSAVNSSIKNMLIIDYCDRAKDMFGLTTPETDSLQTFIYLHIKTEDITSQNIHMYNNIIGYIDNICFDPKMRVFSLTHQPSTNQTPQVDKLGTFKKDKSNPQLEMIWNKYLKNYLPKGQSESLPSIGKIGSTGSYLTNLSSSHIFRSSNSFRTPMTSP